MREEKNQAKPPKVQQNKYLQSEHLHTIPGPIYAQRKLFNQVASIRKIKIAELIFQKTTAETERD